MAAITKDIGISELAEKHPEAIPVLMDAGMHCLGCMASRFETLGQGCEAHGIDADKLVEKINTVLKE